MGQSLLEEIELANLFIYLFIFGPVEEYKRIMRQEQVVEHAALGIFGFGHFLALDGLNVENYWVPLSRSLAIKFN